MGRGVVGGTKSKGEWEREGEREKEREGGSGGDRNREGEIRLSGNEVDELAGPRRDLAGQLSIGHGVDTPPSP